MTAEQFNETVQNNQPVRLRNQSRTSGTSRA